MKVKVSNPMLKALKQAIPQYKFYLLELSPHNYSMLIDYDTWNHEIDFNIAKNVFKAIQVVYPSEYYAMNRYLTTKDLSRCFKESDKTWNGFINQVLREIEI